MLTVIDTSVWNITLGGWNVGRWAVNQNCSNKIIVVGTSGDLLVADL